MLISFWVALGVAVLLARHGWLAVAAGLAAGAVVLWLESLLYPFARCWWCRGNPRRWNGDDTAWHDCWVCGGSGRRRRPMAGGSR